MVKRTRIVFLVQTHTAPEQFGRTVRQLLEVPDAAVVVHVDARSDEAEFRRAADGLEMLTFVPDRTAVYWGGFSQVAATSALLRAALRAHSDAARFCLVSGDTYLLSGPAALADFFDAAPDANYMNVVPFPSPEAGKPETRLSAYFREVPAGNPAAALWWRLVNRFGRRPWRRRLHGKKPFAGSTWWCLSRPAAEEMDRQWDSLPEFKRLCRTSRNPDELWFQTLLMNSPLQQTAQPALMLTEWDPGSASPRFLTTTDLVRLVESGLVGSDQYGRHDFLFARKFRDTDGSSDAWLRQQLWTRH